MHESQGGTHTKVLRSVSAVSTSMNDGRAGGPGGACGGGGTGGDGSGGAGVLGLLRTGGGIIRLALGGGLVGVFMLALGGGFKRALCDGFGEARPRAYVGERDIGGFERVRRRPRRFNAHGSIAHRRWPTASHRRSQGPVKGVLNAQVSGSRRPAKNTRQRLHRHQDKEDEPHDVNRRCHSSSRRQIRDSGSLPF